MPIRPRHLSVRVPWHDNTWNGTVCGDPAGNCHCIEYPNIASKRDVAVEVNRKGDPFASFATPSELPP
jgi:hypothetical protein